MPQFTIRAHVVPDAETGPGEPDIESAETMGKKPGKITAVKKPAQFTLPKSSPKPAKLQKAKPDAKKSG
jgi:hypothetical protein